MKRPQILVLSFSPLQRDPRVNRQLIFLKKRCDLTVAGYGKPLLHDIDYIDIENKYTSSLWQKLIRKTIRAIQLKMDQFEQFYWSLNQIRNAWHLLRDYHFDLILANDISSVPLACKLARQMNAQLFVDAHEFAPRQYETSFKFRFFHQKYCDYLCKTYLPHADAMTTVCEGIAEEYQKCYDVSCEVVTNAPFRSKLEPSEVKKNRIRMIHHGWVDPTRRTENMIHLMDYLNERFTLDFMVINDKDRYYHKLVKMARKNTRIRFRPPAPMNEIAKFTNEYDIGLFLLYPSTFNYEFVLPNKFFEFIQANLAVAIWPSIEMARIIEKYQCGVVSDKFAVDSMAEVLNSLSTNEIRQLKRNTQIAAYELCAEKNEEIMVNIVTQLLT